MFVFPKMCKHEHEHELFTLQKDMFHIGRTCALKREENEKTIQKYVMAMQKCTVKLFNLTLLFDIVLV